MEVLKSENPNFSNEKKYIKKYIKKRQSNSIQSNQIKSKIQCKAMQFDAI